MKIKYGKTNRGDIGQEVIFFILVAVISGLLGALIGVNIMQDKAVKHKAAHYELNPDNGSSSWHWNQ